MLARALTLAATMLATASAVELTKATFQAEVKDSGKNAFVSRSSCSLPGLPALPPSCRPPAARAAALLRWALG